MSRGRPYRFARFARGLNTTDGPYGLKEGYEDDPSGLGSECRDALNVISRQRGNVSRRDGCASLLTHADAIISLSIIGQDADSFTLVARDTGKLYAVDDNLTATELVTGLSTSAPWQFLRLTGTAYGPAYGMNGVDTPRETDGTLAGTGTWTATAGSVPNGTMMAYHENRVMVVGVAATPYRLYASTPGDPRDWDTSANSWVVDFAPDDGSPITGIASLGPYLLVFKERGIWVVYDAETGANRKIVDDAGTTSHRSIATTERGCYFLDPASGVSVTDGQTVTVISDQISDSLDSISYSNKATATAAHFKDHYYLSVSYAGARHIFDFDSELNSWWLHDPQVAAFGVWDRGNGPALIGAMTSPEGSLWEMFKEGETQDASTTYTSYWSGPYHTFGAPHLLKRCRELHMDGRGVVDVYVATDYEIGQGDDEGEASFDTTGTTFGGSGTYGGSGSFAGTLLIGEQSLFNLGVSRAWSVSFYTDSASSWEIDAYTMLMDHRKD